MSQLLQKLKKTPAKKSALDVTHDDALSQTVDTEIELGSQKSSKTPKGRRRKNVGGSQEEEPSQSNEPVTPVRSKSKVDEDEDIEPTPKRKATPAPKKSTKKSSEKDSAEKKKLPTKKGNKRSPPQLVKTAEGDFNAADIETFDLMRRSEPILPRAAFLRVVKEVIRDLQPDFRLSTEAFDILQTAAEDTVTDNFFVANMMAMARKRNTVTNGDVRMAALIKGIYGTGLHQHTSYDMKKVLEAYGYKREDLSVGNTGPDLIAQQGMLKLEMLQAEKDKKAGRDTKPKRKKAKDVGDEDYVKEKKDEKKDEKKKGEKRKKEKKDKKDKDADEEGEHDEDEKEDDEDEPAKKKKKSAEETDEEEY
jgi:histone H3/H4